jgi:hypothetical protein
MRPKGNRCIVDLADQRTTSFDLIAYWNSGAPVYRWNEIAINAASIPTLPGMAPSAPRSAERRQAMRPSPPGTRSTPTTVHVQAK